MYINSIVLLILVQAASLISCWPDFYLYTQADKLQSFKVTADNFKSSPFQANLDTVIVIHGFIGSYDNWWMQDIKDLMLEQSNVNMILVDWAKGAAGPNYIKAKDNVYVTGEKLNEFLRSTGIDPKTIYCIGHSLGAHACGLAAKGLVFKRISGLDPAGPMFKKVSAEERLDKTDALFVDVMNTDGCLGLQRSIGHKTFWPNGGPHQNGCFTDLGLCDYMASLGFRYVPRSDFIACSHSRAYEFFVDSLRSGCNFKSTLCNDFDDFQKGACKCDTPDNCVSMGLNAINGKEYGDFYLYTNKKEPYCQN